LGQKSVKGALATVLSWVGEDCRGEESQPFVEVGVVHLRRRWASEGWVEGGLAGARRGGWVSETDCGEVRFVLVVLVWDGLHGLPTQAFHLENGEVWQEGSIVKELHQRGEDGAPAEGLLEVALVEDEEQGCDLFEDGCRVHFFFVVPSTQEE